MSSVRMCDNCGNIFSEAESGWQTGTVNTIVEDDEGHYVDRRVVQDRCPKCAVGVKGKPKQKPRLDSGDVAQLADPELEAKKREISERAQRELAEFEAARK